MAPVNEYFKGSGERVMRGMRKRYGKDAERVFYATANSRKGMNPKSKKRRKRSSKR